MRTFFNFKMCELNEKTKKELEIARKNIDEGEVFTQEEVEKMFLEKKK